MIRDIQRGHLPLVNKYQSKVIVVELKSCRIEGIEPVDLNDREWDVCQHITSKDRASSFGELRRTSALHPEILSRILRRLQIHGLVRKVDGRYLTNCCPPNWNERG